MCPLTTGADTVVATGVANINGSFANNGASNTWQTWDTIQGGTGVDTLTAELNGGTVVMSNVSSLEKLNLSISGAQTIDAANLASLTDITATSNNTLAINNLGSLPTVNLSSTNTTTLNVLNSALAGTNSLALNLTGGHTGNVTVTDTAGTNTLETLSIDSASTNSIGVLTVSGLGATQLNITGAGQLTVTTLTDAQNTLKTIDGSSSSGGFQITAVNGGATVLGGSGNDSLTAGNGNDSISAGAGNDILTFAATNLTSNDTVNGGEGVNTLVADKDDVDTVAITTAWTNTSNIQTLQFSDALAGDTITTSNIAASINRINVAVATLDASGNPTFNFAAGASTVGFNVADALGANTLTVDAAGTGTGDSLTLVNMLLTGPSLAANSNITVTDYETVTLNSGSVASSAELVNILNTGTAALSITGANGLTTTAGTGVITAASIDASGLTGTAALSMGAAAASITSITGSSNGDVLRGDASSSISGGAGNDSIFGGVENDTLLGQDGDDTIAGGTGNDSISGGLGNDTVTFAAAAELTVSDTVSGGEGTADTLSFTASMTDASASLSRVSEFEILSLAPTAAQTLTMSNFTNNQGFTRVDFGDAGGNTMRLDNVTNDLNTIRLITGAAGDTVRMERLSDISTNAMTVTATADLSVGNAVTGLQLDDEETLNLSGSLSTNDLTITTLTAGDLKTLNITGAADVIITNAIVGSTALATVDASASTGAVTVNASNTGVAVTATAGTGAFNFTGGGFADSITGSAVADTLIGGNGVDTILGGAGADEITGNAGADRLTGGGGDDDFNYGAGEAGNLNGGSAGSATLANTGTAAAGAGVATLTYTVDGVAHTAAATFTGGETAVQIQALLVTAINTASTGSSVFASSATGTLTLTAPVGVAVTAGSITYSANPGTLDAGTANATAATTTTFQNIDTITDMNFDGDQIDPVNNFTAGTLVGSGTAAAVLTGSSLETAVQDLFTVGGSLAGANTFGLFSYGGQVYLIGNAVAVSSIATQGFNSVQGDIMLNVTGFTGTLDASDFIN